MGAFEGGLQLIVIVACTVEAAVGLLQGDEGIGGTVHFGKDGGFVDVGASAQVVQYLEVFGGVGHDGAVAQGFVVKAEAAVGFGQVFGGDILPLFVGFVGGSGGNGLAAEGDALFIFTLVQVDVGKAGYGMGIEATAETGVAGNVDNPQEGLLGTGTCAVHAHVGDAGGGTPVAVVLGTFEASGGLCAGKEAGREGGGDTVFCPGELHGLVEALQGFGVAVEGHQHLGFGGEEASQAVAFQKGEVQALEAVEVALAAFKVY